MDSTRATEWYDPESHTIVSLPFHKRTSSFGVVSQTTKSFGVVSQTTTLRPRKQTRGEREEELDMMEAMADIVMTKGETKKSSPVALSSNAKRRLAREIESARREALYHCEVGPVKKDRHTRGTQVRLERPGDWKDQAVRCAPKGRVSFDGVKIQSRAEMKRAKKSASSLVGSLQSLGITSGSTATVTEERPLVGGSMYCVKVYDSGAKTNPSIVPPPLVRNSLSSLGVSHGSGIRLFTQFVLLGGAPPAGSRSAEGAAKHKGGARQFTDGEPRPSRAKNQKESKRGGKPGAALPPKACFNCQKIGHLRADCPLQAFSDKAETSSQQSEADCQTDSPGPDPWLTELYEKARLSRDIGMCRILRPIITLRNTGDACLAAFDFDGAEAAHQEAEARMKAAGIPLQREEVLATVKPVKQQFHPSWVVPTPIVKPPAVSIFARMSTFISGASMPSNLLGSPSFEGTAFEPAPKVSATKSILGGAVPPPTPLFSRLRPLVRAPLHRRITLQAAPVEEPPHVEVSEESVPEIVDPFQVTFGDFPLERVSTLSVLENEHLFGSVDPYAANRHVSGDSVGVGATEPPVQVKQEASPSADRAKRPQLTGTQPNLRQPSDTGEHVGLQVPPQLEVPGAGEQVDLPVAPIDPPPVPPLLVQGLVGLWTDRNGDESMMRYFYRGYLAMGYSIPVVRNLFRDAFLSEQVDRFGIDSTAVGYTQEARVGLSLHRSYEEQAVVVSMDSGFKGITQAVVYPLLAQRALLGKLSSGAVTPQTYQYVMASVLTMLKEENLTDYVEIKILVDTVKFAVQTLARVSEVTAAERYSFRTPMLSEGLPPPRRFS